MIMTKRMTKRENFELIAKTIETMEIENKAEMLNFIAHEIELLEKKSSKSGQTKTQKENENLKGLILKVLSNAKAGMTITEIQSKNEVLGSLSNQKVSAILRNMVKEGTVTKDTSTKKTLFSERGITVAVELE